MAGYLFENCWCPKILISSTNTDCSSIIQLTLNFSIYRAKINSSFCGISCKNYHFTPNKNLEPLQAVSHAIGKTYLMENFRVSWTEQISTSRN